MKIELPEADIYAGVDKEAIIKVLSNLFSNALKYAGTYAHLYLSADDEESSLLIVMDNDGEVIPLEMRDNIFLPFVRYRDGNKVESGTGIGLALARSLAELHGGSLVMVRWIVIVLFFLFRLYTVLHASYRTVMKNLTIYRRNSRKWGVRKWETRN